MNAESSLYAWNNLFISIALKIGKIYFETSDMNLTLSSVHKEKRWKWVDENFIREATEIYLWLLNHPEEKDRALSCSFEYLSSHVKNSPLSSLSPRIIEGGYLKEYLDN